jgi:hypothetical protein
VELSKLEALTRDYAVFQARKSGLATALGGLMAILLLVVPMHVDFRWKDVAFVLLTPFLWLLLKQLLGRWLYRGFGEVKAALDPCAERFRWLWVFGIALFLLAFQAAVLACFATGRLVAPMACGVLIFPGPWVLGLPFLYLLAAPWWIRGVEEARAYAVLVGLCIVWLWPILMLRHFPWHAGPEKTAFTGSSIMGLLLLAMLVLAWSALAMIRGWREHREYLALLKSLPREDA